MTPEHMTHLVQQQRTFFATGATLPVAYRLKALGKLQEAIRQYTPKIQQALKNDLGKSELEGYMCEIGLTLSEISYMQSHLRRFAKERRVMTPLAQFAAKSYIKPCPYGVTLIMSPWNYPFLLTLEPLVDALSAGNTAVVKPSAYSPHTSQVIQEMLSQCFPAEYVAVVTGGRAENACLLQQHFDHIFFTGSQAVGREVMVSAAAHLTPVTLELGGKSPCIVDETADLPLAAKRIVFGKFLNCGQTCVAPDYILCHEAVHEKLVQEIIRQIKTQFGERPLDNPNYGKIINEKHFNRLLGLMDGTKTVFGGQIDRAALRISPTVLDPVSWADPVMQEEIFGPILPVLTIKSLEDVPEILRDKPAPLALYLFTASRRAKQWITSRCQFGGGCLNDTVIHLATSRLGFGGVGASGMGAYHGKAGFDAFSHRKSIVDKKTWIDLPMRYQPYGKMTDKLIHLFLK